MLKQVVPWNCVLEEVMQSNTSKDEKKKEAWAISTKKKKKVIEHPKFQLSSYGFQLYSYDLQFRPNYRFS